MTPPPSNTSRRAHRRPPRVVARLVGLMLAAALSAGAASADAASSDEPAESAWFVPDLAKVQYAGNIGFVSAAAGYTYLHRTLETELFFGFVPAFVGDQELYIASLKQHVVPHEFSLGDSLAFAPLYVGVFASYTFGSDFELFPDNWAGGKDVHLEQSALRVGPLVGGRLRADIEPIGPIDDIGAYWELNVSDLGLRIYFSNREHFDFYEVMALGLGVRMGFR